MRVFDVYCGLVQGARSDNDEQTVILLGYDLDGLLPAFGNSLVGPLRLGWRDDQSLSLFCSWRRAYSGDLRL